MGTVVSSFPAYMHNTNSWCDLNETFKEGLFRNANGDEDEYEEKISLKNLASEKVRSMNMKYNIDDDLESESEPEPIQVPREEVPIIPPSPTPQKRRSTSRSTFQPSQSRLPTPISRSRRTSDTDHEVSSSSRVNNNDPTQEPTQGQSTSKNNSLEGECSKAMSSGSGAVHHKSDVANFNHDKPEKPFVPEPWPTVDMIYQHLGKLKSLPTTLLFARFVPRNSKVFVEIKYSTNKDTQETVFECSDKLETLIPSKEGNLVGESEQEQIDYFFLIFKTCINLLQGQVWWNGYSLIFDQNSTKSRLKVSAFEMEPSQLLFELTNMKDLEVHRSGHKLELRSKFENGSPDEVKYFKIRGLKAKEVKVSKLRGTLITVHVPEFEPSLVPGQSA